MSASAFLLGSSGGDGTESSLSLCLGTDYQRSHVGMRSKAPGTTSLVAKGMSSSPKSPKPSSSAAGRAENVSAFADALGSTLDSGRPDRASSFDAAFEGAALARSLATSLLFLSGGGGGAGSASTSYSRPQ